MRTEHRLLKRLTGNVSVVVEPAKILGNYFQRNAFENIGSGCGYGTVYPVIYLVKVGVLIRVMIRNVVRVSARTGVRVS